MNPPDESQGPKLPADLSDAVTGGGVFQVVRDGYDAVYDALPRGETFTRIWRDKAYGGDFPAEFAHIGFLTVSEARRMLELLCVGGGGVLADLACGAGGPGLWAVQQSGASLIGIDPSRAGLAAARERARRVSLAERSRFTEGTFERTGLADGAADAVMSVDAFQYAPDKQAAMAEFFRILRPGGRLAFIAFEVDPASVQGLPVLGVDPVADYVPLLELAGFVIEAYEETLGWRDRVHAAFGAIVEAHDALAAEMGEQAAASIAVEAMLTLQVRPYPRRVLATGRRPV
ncbi:MAG TPA: class I SAM-dependent methyltransferase [Streptosporangiaceae bacterium]|nr:class I SAM-dependent methyltransferase [Streptosporangiaceae bacterium]